MITAPVDDFVFRGWTVLSFAILYDFFTVTEKHFGRIGKIVNVFARIYAVAVSVYFFLGLMGSDSMQILNGREYIATADIYIPYNVVKWSFLIFPILMTIEENLILVSKKDNAVNEQQPPLANVTNLAFNHEQSATKED